MNFTLYKPNSKNTGSAFSFTIAKDKKNNPVLFVSMIQQHSWNEKYKTGSFKQNAKDPQKSAVIKLSATEAGEILSSFKTRIPFIAFHKRENDSTIIKFNPWDKKRKIVDNKGESFVDTPAFGLTVSKKSSLSFKLPIEAGETEVLAELFREYIKQSFSTFGKNNYVPKDETENAPEEAIEEDDDEAPF
tara:strand:- start:341 stop:907 length:567 start_codon:yes stop_codon:yes gene_type:complete